MLATIDARICQDLSSGWNTPGRAHARHLRRIAWHRLQVSAGGPS